MIHCLIVEDEPLAADILQDYAKQIPFLQLKGVCTDAIFALEIMQQERIDLIFLDIHLPGLKGLDFLKSLQNPPAVILTTAYHEYALQGYELNVVDYLLKPIRQERLLVALGKAAAVKPEQADAAAKVAQSKRRHLSIHERGKIVLVPVDDVLYLKAELKYVTVRTAQKEFLLEESLTRLEEEFGPMFTRIHRNTLVATKAVSGFEKVAENGQEDSDGGGNHWVAVIRGVPEKLPVSRRQQHVVKEF